MNDKSKAVLKEIFEWIYCFLIAIVIAIVVKYYIGVPTIVKHKSMYPTLIENQRLILNRWIRTTSKDYKRGDIVTFEAPSVGFIAAEDADLSNPIAIYEEVEGLFNKFRYYVLEIGKQSYIKRVIGLPGEHVKIENGKVYINGEELQEDYLQDGVITDSLDGAFTDIVVPEGCLFLMGDNRSGSSDCRRFGCIPIEKIEGKVWIRFWPLNLFGTVE